MSPEGGETEDHEAQQPHDDSDDDEDYDAANDSAKKGGKRKRRRGSCKVIRGFWVLSCDESVHES